MNDRGDYRALMQNALTELKRLRAELDAERAPHTAPVAVIGMACRFPGADTPDDFWRLLHSGREAVGPVPADRWNIDAYYDPDPDAPGKMSSRRGGFLTDVSHFDCRFFGITPCEARSLDPQQRLLLEVAWEALEHAGQPADRLYGTAGGVFVGISHTDYAQLLRRAGDPAAIDAYFGTGNSSSVASGRLSYVLGWQGPSIVVDTACSSSLVSVHLAVRSLRAGECEFALAGAPNLMLAPETSISFSKAHMLAADGRCKTFDRAADGYVRGEGCGLVLLKRLADAITDGDRVLAVIRGSAVNHDGRSAGLTAPNGPAQEVVLRRALAEAGFEPNQLDYIEAHGTGTALGDPIELGALANVFAGRSVDRPLLVGSVKTNIGHLEAAAGIAGLIKAVLAIDRKEIPPHLNFEEWNPHVVLDRAPLAVPTRPTAWPDHDATRAAGVSSFSFSGTNAHLVISSLPATEREQVSEAPAPYLLVLSAKTRPALTALTAVYARHLAEQPGQAWRDVCFTASAGRSHFSERLALVAETGTEAAEMLRRFLAGDEHAGVVAGPANEAIVATAVQKISDRESLGRLAQEYVAGGTIDWRQLFADSHRQVCTLPTYPFQRERFWFTDSDAHQRAARDHAAAVHVDEQRASAAASPATEISFDSPDWTFLDDHRVYAASVVPGAVWLELALAAAQKTNSGAKYSLAGVEFHRMLALPGDRTWRVQVLLSSTTNDRFHFQIVGGPPSAEPSEAQPTLYASGEIVFEPAKIEQSDHQQPLDDIRRRMTQPTDPEVLYDRLANHGLDYGPAFRCIESLHCGDGEALARVCRPDASKADKAGDHQAAMLDACLQALAAAVPQAALRAADATAYLPVGIKSVRLFGALPERIWSYARVRETAHASPPVLEGDVRILSDNGEPLGELHGVRLEGFRRRTAARRAPAESASPRRGPATQPAEASHGHALSREALLAAPADERYGLLERHLHDRLVETLELTDGRLDVQMPLLNLGLDSLMVFKLGNQLERSLGIELRMQDLLAGPSVAQLTAILLAKLEAA